MRRQLTPPMPEEYYCTGCDTHGVCEALIPGQETAYPDGSIVANFKCPNCNKVVRTVCVQEPCSNGQKGGRSV